MMNVGIILWTANVDPGRCSFARSPWSIAVSTERCLVCSRRRHRRMRALFDIGHRQISMPKHASGLARRQRLVARPGLGDLWLRGRAPPRWRPRFLATARRCADFYLRRAPGGTVPLWDFDVHDDGRQPLDSSAAAIAASGLSGPCRNEVTDLCRQRPLSRCGPSDACDVMLRPDFSPPIARNGRAF